jgi:UDP-N-acetylmuramate dehydrogenase
MPAPPQAAMIIREHASLAALNTFRVDANARWLVELDDARQLPAALAHPDFRDLPLLVLGEGSNTLFARDFDGVVLRLTGRRVTESLWVGDDAVVRVEAGRNWHDFVMWSLAQGYVGLENLALIPGTVGAAPIQNIGAYGVELARHVDAVEVWDRTTGAYASLDHTACAFGYRDSIFKQAEHRGRWIVTGVRFRFRPDTPLVLDYAGVREELAAMGVDAPCAHDVADAVIRLRRRKLPDPAEIGNAGSFFKNPIVAQVQADALRAAYPALPVYPAADGLAKLSAAWLIEQTGWKGFRDGDVGVSDRHALVLVNHGHAAGADLLRLATRIADSVRERYGVELEPEPVVVGAVQP